MHIKLVHRLGAYQVGSKKHIFCMNSEIFFANVLHFLPKFYLIPNFTKKISEFMQKICFFAQLDMHQVDCTKSILHQVDQDPFFNSYLSNLFRCNFEPKPCLKVLKSESRIQKNSTSNCIFRIHLLPISNHTKFKSNKQ